jgi:hypothetical protein
MRATKTVADRKRVAQECFLDGVTECESDKSCGMCRYHETRWLDSWSAPDDKEPGSELPKVLKGRPEPSRALAR